MAVSLTLSSITWDAAATLIAGFAAVVGAVAIGFRQTKIANRQNDILEQQSVFLKEAREQDKILQTKTLRVSLLHERSQFIDRFRTVWGAFMANARLTDEEWRELAELFQRAQLLYPVDIAKDLDALSTAIFRSKLHYRRAEAYHAQGKETEATKKLEEAFAADDTTFAIMQTMLDRLVAASRIEIDS